MTMTNSNPSQNQTSQAPTSQPVQSPAPLAVTSEFRFALEPTSFDATLRACELLASAQIVGCESPPLILAKVMVGRALGMGFMQSVMGIDNIKGTMSLRAKTKVALCLQSTVCEYFRCTETTETSSTWATKRVGEEEKTYTFTIQEAHNSKLTGRGEGNNWDRFPAAMLRARASSYLADIVYPDVLKGMVSTEELNDVHNAGNEMVGEVVHSAPPTNAPVRDFAAESKTILAKIERITPETVKLTRDGIRKEVLDWDGPEPYKSTLIRAYNESPPAPRRHGPGPSSPAQTTVTAPPVATEPPAADAKRVREPGEEG